MPGATVITRPNRLGTSGMRIGGSSNCRDRRSQVVDHEARRSADAVTSPRDNVSTSPLASTTRQRLAPIRRTVPYLNVAAPAALVATAPPTRGAEIGRHRRQPSAVRAKRVLQCLQRDAGADRRRGRR